ncbi:MAG: hypothetical protein E7629_06625 [Ruminococcaceae bacterium]|nr:hypothetical protein [Oscillospiraceae bacterium]
MKRFLAILLAFLMLFAVCACDEKKDDKKDGESGEEGTTAYTGSLLGSGDDATLSIDGDVATFEVHLVNKGGNSQQDYFINITAPFTKDGEKYVFDFTQEGAKALAKLSVTGEGALDFLEIIKNLSYNRDPLYVEFCEGKEVEITTESTVWGAIGIPKSATIQLNSDGSFDVIR